GYCLGLGLPFLLLAFGSARAMRTVGWLRRHSRTIQMIGGALMIAVGIALLSGDWGYFINWVRQWTVEFGATLTEPRPGAPLGFGIVSPVSIRETGWHLE